jgi:hypothetical protein
MDWWCWVIKLNCTALLILHTNVYNNRQSCGVIIVRGRCNGISFYLHDPVTSLLSTDLIEGRGKLNVALGVVQELRAECTAIMLKPLDLYLILALCNVAQHWMKVPS